jgi:UDP-N-acetylmuramoylalanine--D-glutamate ligase
MGIEGGSLARYFLRQGARVTVHHWMAREELLADPRLGEQYRELRALGAEFRLGSEYLSGLTEQDVVGVLQSVFTYKYPQNREALAEVQRRGIPLVTNLSIFFDRCPAPIIGVTGTNGKSTTTEMAAAALQRGSRRVFAGGNLGSSPLDVLDELRRDDLVLLELSNYQLEFLDTSPWIAAVTNIAPDHLVDYGGDYAAYQAAKHRILAFQTPEDWAVLNADDPTTRAWATTCRAGPLLFSRSEVPGDGAFVREGRIVVRVGTAEEPICGVGDLRVRGAHNLENALCATAIAALCGIAAQDIGQALTQYTTGEHRLEFVGEWRGIAVYNDSKSTTPSSTLAAIRAFPDRPLILLAGGRDKGLPMDELARAIARQVRHFIAFGEAAETLVGAVEGQGGRGHRVPTLDEAVELALRLARPGDVVLLSPACTSFDAFQSYAERGRYFKALVHKAFGKVDG